MLVNVIIGICGISLLIVLFCGIKIGIQKKIISDLTENIEWLENKKAEGGLKHKEMNEKIQKLNKRVQIQQSIINRLNEKLGIKTPYEYKEKK